MLVAFRQPAIVVVDGHTCLIERNTFFYDYSLIVCAIRIIFLLVKLLTELRYMALQLHLQLI